MNSSSRSEHFVLLTAYGLKLDMWHLLLILTPKACQPLAKQDICPIPIKSISPWPPKTCHPLRLSFWVLLSYIPFIPMATRMYSYYGVYHDTKLFVCLILYSFLMDSFEHKDNVPSSFLYPSMSLACKCSIIMWFAGAIEKKHNNEFLLLASDLLKRQMELEIHKSEYLPTREHISSPIYPFHLEHWAGPGSV